MLIDLVLIALALQGLLRGYRRGLSRAAIATSAWVFGIPIAFRLGSPLGERLFTSMAPFAARLFGGLAVLFVISLLAWLLEVALLGRSGEIDDAERLGGAAIGLFRGMVSAALIAILFGATTITTGLGRAAADSTIVTTLAAPDGMGLRVFEAATGQSLLTDLIAFNRRYPAGALLDDEYRSLPASDPSEVVADEETAFEILAMVNEERRASGQSELQWWGPLADVGEAYAEEMAVHGFFAHDSPRTGDVGDRAEAGGIDFRALGENLALAPNADAAHRGLMNSPGHRENILRPLFTHIGIGVVRTPLGLIVVQVFYA